MYYNQWEGGGDYSAPVCEGGKGLGLVFPSTLHRTDSEAMARDHAGNLGKTIKRAATVAKYAFEVASPSIPRQNAQWEVSGRTVAYHSETRGARN